MTLTSKQRAKLRGIASTEDTIFQLGKGGVTDNFIKSVNDALEARELIKFRVLESALVHPGDIAAEVAEATDAIVVTVIGSKVVLYRQGEKNKFEI